MAILIADKGYFRVKTIAKNKDCDLIKIKGSSSQEDTKILNVSSCNSRTLRYIRKPFFKKGKIVRRNRQNPLVRIFNHLLLVIGQVDRKKSARTQRN